MNAETKRLIHLDIVSVIWSYSLFLFELILLAHAGCIFWKVSIPCQFYKSRNKTLSCVIQGLRGPLKLFVSSGVIVGFPNQEKTGDQLNKAWASASVCKLILFQMDICIRAVFFRLN